MADHFMEKCEKLYNAKQKHTFLQSHYSSEANKMSAANILLRVAPFEQGLGRDLYTFSDEELRPVFEEILTMKSSGKAHVVNVVRHYFKWCVSNNIPGARAFTYQVGLDSIAKTRTRMVASPAHLHHVLNQFYRKESDDTVENVYRAYFWLAFMGFPQRFSAEITKEHIDFSDMVITISGKSSRIYPEALASFKSIASLTSFNTTNKKCSIHETPPKWVRRDRIKGDWLLRGLVSAHDKAKQKNAPDNRTDQVDPDPDNRLASLRRTIINNKLLESKKLLRSETADGLHITYETVLQSGIFYRQYDLEKFTHSHDFRPIVRELILAKSERALQNESYLKKQVSTKVSLWEDDYAQWLAAFEL